MWFWTSFNGGKIVVFRSTGWIAGVFVLISKGALFSQTAFLLRAALFSQAALISQAALSLDYDYTLYSSAEYTDNIRQGGVGEDNISGNIYAGGIDFDAATDPSAVFAGDIAGNFEQLYYSEGGLDAESRKLLDASFLYQPKSNNFRLSVIESIQQVAADRLSVRTVDNLRDVNILAVVPSYHIDLTPISRIRASYSYATIDDELQRASRDVGTTTVGYEYSVSNRSDWSLNASRSDIRFSDGGPEYDQESAFVRWTYDGNLADWQLDLGRQRIAKVDDANETLVNFSLIRQINRVSDLSASYHQGYSDVVNTRVGGRLTELVPNSDAVFADELAREKDLALIYRYTQGRLGASLGVDARRLETETAVAVGRELDEDRYGYTAALEYRFLDREYRRSRFGLRAAYRDYQEDFNLLDSKNQVGVASLRFNYTATRKVNFFLELLARDTSGTGPEADTDENAFILGLEFSPRGVD